MTQNRAAIRYVFLRLGCVGVLLGTVAPLGAQNPDDLRPSVVRITSAGGQGSGVVVAIERESAIILTAYHVLGTADRYDVVFAGAPEHGSFEVAATNLIGRQSNDDKFGLAAFRVRGAIPAAVRAARLEATMALQRGDSVVYWGFPNRSTTVLRVGMSVSAPEGTNFVTDRSLGEGASGGAIAKDGKVVGIAAARDGQLSYGVTSRVAVIALEGWGVTLAPERPVPPTDVRNAARSPVPAPTGTTDIKLQFVPADIQFSQYGCSLQIGVNIGGSSANPSSNPFTVQNVPLGRQNYQITGQVACSLYGGQVCVAQGRGTITVDEGGTYGLQLSPIVPGKPCEVTLVKQ